MAYRLETKDGAPFQLVPGIQLIDSRLLAIVSKGGVLWHNGGWVIPEVVMSLVGMIRAECLKWEISEHGDTLRLTAFTQDNRPVLTAERVQPRPTLQKEPTNSAKDQSNAIFRSSKKRPPSGR